MGVLARNRLAPTTTKSSVTPGTLGFQLGSYAPFKVNGPGVL